MHTLIVDTHYQQPGGENRVFAAEVALLRERGCVVAPCSPPYRHSPRRGSNYIVRSLAIGIATLAFLTLISWLASGGEGEPYAGGNRSHAGCGTGRYSVVPRFQPQNIPEAHNNGCSFRRVGVSGG